MKTSTKIKKMLKLFRGGKNWTKGTMCERGHYCLAGAAAKVSYGGTPWGNIDKDLREVLETIARNKGYVGITSFNDSNNYALVDANLREELKFLTSKGR